MPGIVAESEAPPMHGYRGERTPRGTGALRGLTIAISRECGARGQTIGQRVAEHLGWQLFDQEALGYLLQDETARQELLAEMPDAVLEWADDQRQRLIALRPDVAPMSDWLRLVFAVGARGEAVILGRGAGFLLPPASTLNVRIIAPLDQRVAYMGQWLRLPTEAARREVESRDAMRSALHMSVVGRAAHDLTQYDLILNSARLGEAACADVIAEALRSKQLPSDSSESSSDELPVV